MPQAHIDPVIPSPQDAVLARAAQCVLERGDANDQAVQVRIRVAGDEAAPLDLPPVVMRLLLDILKETAAGHAVSLVPVEAEITTQQAATILNVSRPFVVGLINKGVLPSRLVGNQHRLPLQEVLAHKAETRAKRRATLNEMTALDQELGLL